MDAQKLVHMANQIGLNFRQLPEEQAVAAIAEHLKSFWTPAMRRTLVEHARADGAALLPSCLRAVEKLEQPAGA